MEIEADLERCIGAGVCARIAPGLFDQNPEDGRVVLLSRNPAPEDAEDADEAVLSCPSGALSLREQG